MLQLGANDIHLWLSYFDEISAPDIQDRYRELLTEHEREQEGRFYFPHDRYRYLVTRAMVRLVLSRYAAVNPQDWRFAKNGFGRPAVANPPRNAQDIDFNISHTKSLIVVGIVSGPAFGVDVENTQSRQPPLGVADSYFSQQEVAELRALPEARQYERFYDYWTLKEAYIKARGLGLHIPLDLFSFHFCDPAFVSMSAHDGLNDAPSRWRFWQFRPRREYLMAVCCDRVADDASRITIRETRPLISEQVIECPALRTSI